MEGILDKEEIEEKSEGIKFYPGISDRIKSIIADSLVLVGLMVLIGNIFHNMNDVPEAARIVAFVFVFFLYDPIFTSLFGGTIGHFLVGLRVKREQDTERNIFIHLAVIRYSLKVFLGIVSMITINRNNKGQAIHDLVVGSVVLYKPKD